MKTLFEELISAILEDTTPTSETYKNALEASKPYKSILGCSEFRYKNKNLPAEIRQALIYADYTDKSVYLFIEGEKRKLKFIRYLKETLE